MPHIKRYALRLFPALLLLSLSTPSPADDPPKSPPAKTAKKPAALPRQIDLRPQFIQLGLMPRGQGARNTCSVFVTTGVLEFALSKHLGRGEPLSVEYLNWACNQVIKNKTEGRGQFFHHLLKGFEQHGICPEMDMPYRARFDPALNPSDKAREKAKVVLGYPLKVHWINPLKKAPGLTDQQLSEIKDVLAKGWPVAAGSSHSRLLVGYLDDPRQPGGGILITKDSGPGAFDTVTYEFAKTKIADVYWVDVPAKTTKGRRE